jgi:hypothetical protein
MHCPGKNKEALYLSLIKREESNLSIFLSCQAISTHSADATRPRHLPIFASVVIPFWAKLTTQRLSLLELSPASGSPTHMELESNISEFHLIWPCMGREANQVFVQPLRNCTGFATHACLFKFFKGKITICMLII